MGDRANVVVLESNSPGQVYLYTHHEGTYLPLVVQAAMQRKARWNDSTYLARIIFNAMTAKDPNGETGFGISSQMTDNNHPLVVVDCHKQEVRFTPEGWERIADTVGLFRIPFDAFVKADPDELLKAYEAVPTIA